MCKKLIYLVSFIFVLSIAAGAQATPIPVSVDSSVESVIGADALAPPVKALNTYDLQVKNFTQGRRVTLVSFDISGLKKDYQKFANMKLSVLGGNSSGGVDVYGVIEDQDNISSGLTWRSAPGVNNDQPLGYPVDLDEADLTDKLLGFTSPKRDERNSVGSAALDDFINTDTDGVVTLLLAPAKKGTNALMKSNRYSDGGVTLAGEITTGMDIIFVSFHGADDTPSDGAAGAGLTEAADKEYTDLLNADAHNVTRYITTGSPDPNVLNAADLVIVSRSVSSGGYSGDSATAWNGISAPMIILGGYVLRTSRMGYTTGTTMVDTTGDIRLTVSDSTHPIFDGIALTDGTMDNPFAEGAVPFPADPNIISRGISINNDPLNPYGKVLAAISEASAETGPVGGMVIGEWPAGAIMTHSGGAGTDILAGHRLVFLTGSRETSGISSETAGLYDLYEDGAQMFLNAVIYMGSPAPTAAMVVSSTDLTAGFDQAQKDRLESSGYLVVAVTGDDVKNEVFPAAAAEMFNVLVVSESIGSSAANNLIGANVPMMHQESYGWSRHFFTQGLAKTWLNDPNGMVNVVNDAHPIIADAGLAAGQVAFFTDPNVAWTTDSVESLVAGAENLAQITNSEGVDYTIIFAIEAGTELADASLAANRICGFSLPGQDPLAADVMTDEAWAMFDAAIDWLDQ
jgi:hypothetical protein